MDRCIWSRFPCCAVCQNSLLFWTFRGLYPLSATTLPTQQTPLVLTAISVRAGDPDREVGCLTVHCAWEVEKGGWLGASEGRCRVPPNVKGIQGFGYLVTVPSFYH